MALTKYNATSVTTPLPLLLHQILGVKETADYDVIKAAFRSAAKSLHPDVNPDVREPLCFGA